MNINYHILDEIDKEERHDLDINDFSACIEKSNRHFDGVHDPVTSKLDAQYLDLITQRFLKYTKNHPIVKNEIQYNPDKWISNLVHNCGGIEPLSIEFWSHLEDKLQSECIKQLPSFNFLYGTEFTHPTESNLVQSQRGPASVSGSQKQPKNNYSKDRVKDMTTLKKPESVNTSGHNQNFRDNQEYVPEVEKLYNRVRVYCESHNQHLLMDNPDRPIAGDGTSPHEEGSGVERMASWTVGFWPLVLDSSSYDATVRNIFYVSLLMKDGHAMLCPAPPDAEYTIDEHMQSTHNEDSSSMSEALEATNKTQFNRFKQMANKWPRIKISPTGDYGTLVNFHEIENNPEDQENNEIQDESIFTNIELTQKQWVMLKGVVKPINVDTD